MLLLRKKTLFRGEKNIVNCAYGSRKDFKDSCYLLRTCHVLGTCAKGFTYLSRMLLIAFLLGMYYQTHFIDKEPSFTPHSPIYSFNK